MIIVTSDHGEALYERGYGNHGTGLFDDEVAIPFAARFPALPAGDHRVDCPVGLIERHADSVYVLGREVSGHHVRRQFHCPGGRP